MTNCGQCLWHDLCGTHDKCDHFTPFEEDVDVVIESGRTEFHADWESIIREYGD